MRLVKIIDAHIALYVIKWCNHNEKQIHCFVVHDMSIPYLDAKPRNMKRYGQNKTCA